MILNGREIDTSCPFSGTCWSEQACFDDCPPNLLDVLRNSAMLEHECDMLPHTDPDLEELCRHPYCKEIRHGRLSSEIERLYVDAIDTMNDYSRRSGGMK